jgi:hypothetical protein
LKSRDLNFTQETTRDMHENPFCVLYKNSTFSQLIANLDTVNQFKALDDKLMVVPDGIKDAPVWPKTALAESIGTPSDEESVHNKINVSVEEMTEEFTIPNSLRPYCEREPMFETDYPTEMVLFSENMDENLWWPYLQSEDYHVFQTYTKL